MKRAEEYITREISRMRGTAIWKTPESSSGVVSEEEKKKSSLAEARGRTLTLLSTTLLTILFPNDLIPQRSCPTVDEVLAKAQFLSPLLYQIHCIGPVRFGFAHIYSERYPLKRDSTIGAVCGKNLCASKNDNQTRQGQTPKRER